MMRCSQARRRILASRDARLSLAERLELDEHLAACETCRALDAADAGLEEAVTALEEPPVEQLDLDAAVHAIGARIDAVEREAAARRVRRVTTWRRLGTVAAAAALLVVTWSVLGRRDPAPPRPEPASPGGTAVAAAEPVASQPVASQPAASQPAASQPVAPQPVAPQPGEQGPVVTQPPPTAEPALELERLERARAAVREAFALAVAGAPSDVLDPGALDPEVADPDGLAARLAAARAPLAALAREGWPVTRLAERVVTDPDPAVAALATRWLGREGDRLAIGTLASVLRRPDVPAGLKQQAVLALLDDGEPGVEALAPALEDAVLRPLALQGLVARGGPVAARVVEDALGATSADPGRASDLAAALAQLGEPGLDALLSAVALHGAASEAALAQLRSTRGAPERLAALLATRAPARAEDARLLAASHLGLDEALPRLRELALDRGRRARALDALAAFEGPGALAVLLDLWSTGRVSSDELTAVARAQLERDPARAVALCEQGIPPDQRAARLPHLLDLLLSTESSAAAPALACLAGSRFLGSDERQWAALALADLGSEAEADALTGTLRGLFPAEDRVAAACALAIHALAGPEALREALGPAARQRSDRLVALLERRPSIRNQAATLSRASRLLEPWLEPDHPERTRTAP